jgi:hypothetical protein
MTCVPQLYSQPVATLATTAAAIQTVQSEEVAVAQLSKTVAAILDRAGFAGKPFMQCTHIQVGCVHNVCSTQTCLLAAASQSSVSAITEIAANYMFQLSKCNKKNYFESNNKDQKVCVQPWSVIENLFAEVFICSKALRNHYETAFYCVVAKNPEQQDSENVFTASILCIATSVD